MAIIFQDGFEKGWTPWTYSGVLIGSGSGPRNSGGGAAVLDSTIVHGGVTSARFTLPAVYNSYSLGIRTFAPSLKLYSSNWFRYDNTTIPIGSSWLIGPCLCPYNDWDLPCAWIINQGGTLKWMMAYSDGVTGNFLDYFQVSNLGPAILPRTWYNVQVLGTIAHGTAEFAMWVMKEGDPDWTRVCDVTGLTTDNIAVGPSGQNGYGLMYVQVGPFQPDNTGIFSPSQQAFPSTCWIDDVVVSDTFIPVSSPPKLDFMFNKAYVAGTPVDFVVTKVA